MRGFLRSEFEHVVAGEDGRVESLENPIVTFLVAVDGRSSLFLRAWYGY
jgi:hypothetical protein